MAKRGRTTRRDAVNAVIAQQSVPVETIDRPEIIRPEFIRAEVPAAPSQPRDLEYLVTIARRHAALALATPPDARADRLDACRMVWLNYAAAFGAGVAARSRFADDLQNVTRALMDEQQRSGTAPAAPAETQLPAEAPILTIEELRPLLQQIIRQ
jgi:hypothetical protein